MISSSVSEAVRALHNKFNAGMPYRHVVINDLFDNSFGERLLGDYTVAQKGAQIGEQRRRGRIESLREIGPSFAGLVDLIHSDRFREFLHRVTGIRDVRCEDYCLDEVGPMIGNARSPSEHWIDHHSPVSGMQRRVGVTLLLGHEPDDQTADHRKPGTTADTTFDTGQPPHRLINVGIIAELKAAELHEARSLPPQSDDSCRWSSLMRLRLWARGRSPIDRAVAIHCLICGREAEPPRPLGFVTCTHSGSFARHAYQLVECEDCAVVRLDPLPTSQDLRILYEQSDQFSDAHYTDPEQVARILDYYGGSLDRLDLLPKSGERMLEVGAGLAWVARACKSRDATIATVAQDVTTECAKSCPWVDEYIVGPVDCVPEATSFALISLTHVIEHLTDPGAMLESLAGRLAIHGKLFITAPYRPEQWSPGDGIDSWRGYSYLHVPAHVSYLSRVWFELACEKSGLRLIHWDQGHENGQAFEAVLARAESGVAA